MGCEADAWSGRSQTLEAEQKSLSSWFRQLRNLIYCWWWYLGRKWNVWQNSFPHISQLAWKENLLTSLDSGSCSQDHDICRLQSCCVSHLVAPPLVPCPPTHTAAPCPGGPGVRQCPKIWGTQLHSAVASAAPAMEHVLFTKYCSKYSLVPWRTEVWGNKGNRRRFLAFFMNCRKGRRLFLA